MCKSHHFIILLFFILISIVSCQLNKKREAKTPIRIIDSGIMFDGGTVGIHYLNQEGKLIKVFINKGHEEKNPAHYLEFGRIYLNIYPDKINYVKDNQEILRIIGDLIYWYNYNIKIYTNLSIADYSSDLESKFKKDVTGSHYDKFWLNTAENVESALILIKGKYPELYKLAEAQNKL